MIAERPHRGAPNETVLNSACQKQAKADHLRDGASGVVAGSRRDVWRVPSGV